MDRSMLESAAVCIVCVAIFFVANLLNLNWLNRQYSQSTPQVIKLDRLPFRFSLRTLLIATTLMAVVLGLGVWLAR
jgi:hypothetical protein